jgi:type IV pilus assembly protein PilA
VAQAGKHHEGNHAHRDLLQLEPMGSTAPHAPRSNTPSGGAMPISVRDEDGFTLIELLVVILIIGILAAIALPSFIGQQQKAQDTDAKTNARQLVTAVESCYATEVTYLNCTSAKVGPESGLLIGSAKGQVDVSIVDATSYTVTAISKSGGTFKITRPTTGPLQRTCSGGSKGCNGGSW